MIEIVVGQDTLRSMEKNGFNPKAMVGKACVWIRTQPHPQLLLGVLMGISLSRLSGDNLEWRITVNNLQFDLAPGDILRSFEPDEDFSFFFTPPGRNGRLSVRTPPAPTVPDHEINEAIYSIAKTYT